MDGHKCMKLYILMHKYIADIVLKFFSTLKKIIPPSSQLLSKFLFLPNFYFIKLYKKKHFREIFPMYKLFLTDSENSSV